MADTNSGTPLALVTGASSGIGRALAEQFVEHGFDVVIAAEDAGLNEAAAGLRSSGRRVIPVQVDLSTRPGVEQLHAEVTATGRPLEAAALNAGVGLGGAFSDQDLDEILELVNVNVVSTVLLARLVLAQMVARGQGKLLLTSSIAAMAPGPFQAVYNASKSFVQSFAEAVADEVRETGVTVTAVQPGPTETEFFDRAGLTDTKLGAAEDKDDPSLVAEQAFEALMAGSTKKVVGGLKTRAEGGAMKVLPDKAKAVFHRKETEPGSAG